MIGHAAVWAKQTASFPSSTAAAAAQITASLYTADFRKSRPSSAHRTVAFQPARRDGSTPGSVAGAQQWDRQEKRNSFKRFQVHFQMNRDLLQWLEILAEGSSKQVKRIYSVTCCPVKGCHLRRAASNGGGHQPL